MNTREEEIIEASQKCIYTLPATPRSGFRDGAKWAISKYVSALEAEIAVLKSQLESACEQLKMNAENMYKLNNPWRDAKKDPPKLTDAYYVRTKEGCADIAFYDKENDCWYNGKTTDGTPKLWMPIPKIPKGE